MDRWTKEDAAQLFHAMKPGFFDRPEFKNAPEDIVMEELICCLDEYKAPQIAAPDGIRFDFYTGDLDALRKIVARVEPGWVHHYTPENQPYCAFDGDRVVAFCILDQFGERLFCGKTVKIAGPGCVGTIPEYRRRGIGGAMVVKATEILRERGYDYSYIHFTGESRWYQSLGYMRFLQWNKYGLL